MNCKKTFVEQGIVWFWACWSTIVLFTDSIDFLQRIQWLPDSIAFTSKNFDLVAKSLATYHWDYTPVVFILYGMIVLWSLLIASLFWRAIFAARQSLEIYLSKVQQAFWAMLLMTAIFLLADEIFIQYEFGHSHMMRLGFMLLTYLIFNVGIKVDKA